MSDQIGADQKLKPILRSASDSDTAAVEQVRDRSDAGSRMLTEAEATRLRVKEHEIERGAQQVGEALRDIRNEHLYRATHATFEEYCQERWSIGRNYADKQIMAAEIAAGLSTNVPIREAHARELAPLRADPERMREVWKAANDATGGKPTAAAIRGARDPEPVVPDEVVDAEIVEDEPEPEPRRITGRDGKTYRPTTASPTTDVVRRRRRPLPEAYRDTSCALLKSAQSLSRLHQDDRFTANREAVQLYGNELACVANELDDLLDDLGIDRHRPGSTGGSNTTTLVEQL